MGSFLVNFILGGIAGGIAKTPVSPLENVKLAHQIQGLPLPSATKEFQAADFSPITGIISTASRCGFTSLWAGNLISILRYYPTQILNFALKDSVKSIAVGLGLPANGFIGGILTGTLAGAISLLVVYPFDTIRTRLAIDRVNGIGKYNSKSDFLTNGCLGKMISEEGISSLYAGFGASILGIIIYRGFYFGLYDSLRQFMYPQGGSKSFFKGFIMAQLVTITAGLVSYPFDTIRRVQMMGGGNIVQATCLIYEHNGLAGFFKGSLDNILRTICAALVLVGYDIIVSQLNKKLS